MFAKKWFFYGSIVRKCSCSQFSNEYFELPFHGWLREVRGCTLMFGRHFLHFYMFDLLFIKLLNFCILNFPFNTSRLPFLVEDRGSTLMYGRDPPRSRVLQPVDGCGMQSWTMHSSYDNFVHFLAFFAFCFFQFKFLHGNSAVYGPPRSQLLQRVDECCM